MEGCLKARSPSSSPGPWVLNSGQLCPRTPSLLSSLLGPRGVCFTLDTPLSDAGSRPPGRQIPPSKADNQVKPLDASGAWGRLSDKWKCQAYRCRPSSREAILAGPPRSQASRQSGISRQSKRWVGTAAAAGRGYCAPLWHFAVPAPEASSGRRITLRYLR